MNDQDRIETAAGNCEVLRARLARIACLEGEIAKRDEELAACRVAVENCELFRARIAEMQERFDSSAHRTSLIGRLEIENDQLRSELSAIKAQEPVMDAPYGGILRIEAGNLPDSWVRINPCKLYALPVSEAKAQGVVMPEGWIPLTIEHDPGYPEDVAFGPKRMMDRLKKWLDRYFEMRLNAAHVQQVSVPTHEMIMAGEDQWERSGNESPDVAAIFLAMLAASPAAPAADAGLVDMYRHLQTVTPYRFKKIQDASVTDGGDVLYFHKDRFDAALLADMAAHCAAKGVV